MHLNKEILSCIEGPLNKMKTSKLDVNQNLHFN